MSSEHRRPAIPFTDAPRGTCRWCGETIVYVDGAREGTLDRRRRWHPQCVDIYNATDPREARALVRKRDRGVCAACGLDTNALRRRVRGRGRARKLRELGFKVRMSLWELDHVVPLIDGGGHGLDNLQTLCTPCHKRKTADEARARAARRAVAREGTAECTDPPPSAARPGPHGAMGTPPSTSAGREGTDPTTRPRQPGRARDPEGELDRLLEAATDANARAEALLERLVPGQHG